MYLKTNSEMLLNYYHSEQVTLAIFFNISRYHKYTCMYIFFAVANLVGKCETVRLLQTVFKFDRKFYFYDPHSPKRSGVA